ncbi:DUF6538 domain-containing protein [Phyllobacterium phragmitis]|uniref:DUF6538 domain-containing protein n=1 Tax=Phyllobacterium phragmitis TaxID=2670329 RepID=UPI0011B1CA3B|nr:DUF6538 domain-containing protein [Phyllobacterium phragmitis]
MANKKSGTDPDRHLQQRGGIYHHKRRVPAQVANLDARAQIIRRSLKTASTAMVQTKRDVLGNADNEYGRRFLIGNDADAARGRYHAAVKRVEALVFSYKDGGRNRRRATLVRS